MTLQHSFPEHSGELSLTHNQHKSYYQTAKAWIEEHECRDPGNCFFEWVSAEQRQKTIDTNEVWVLQWYPHTPVGFNCLAAADLEVLLAASLNEK